MSRPLLQVMGLVELEPLSEVVIGMAGTGLSIEARKRTSIAVELVANPGKPSPLQVSCHTTYSLLTTSRGLACVLGRSDSQTSAREHSIPNQG